MKRSYRMKITFCEIKFSNPDLNFEMWVCDVTGYCKDCPEAILNESKPKTLLLGKTMLNKRKGRMFGVV